MASVNIPMDLEVRCWSCQGIGKDEKDPEQVCFFCDGIGYKTTDFGDSLLTFLDHFRPTRKATEAAS